MSVNFKFLDERPLQTSEEFANSHFGHGEIASTLVKIVKNSPAPFTIGLFAKWGAGKSTVANSLKTQLPKEDIPVVLFDVWKHEGDALRRTFLKEMVSQLHQAGEDFFDTSFQLNDQIQESISRDVESKIKFRADIVAQLWPYVAFGIVIAILIGLIADTYGKIDLFLSFIFSIFGVTGGAGVIIWLLQNSVNLFTKESVTHAIDKFEDPHQFETEFGNILRSLRHKRILIIFDNLDRVMHDKVAEVLSTIKTFLEPQDIANEGKEVVFLVPCDAKAIKKHLSNLYNPKESKDSNGKKDNVFDPDEFLRKFFNTIIWIPDFIPGELESFARECLKKTEVALLDDDYVAWIITKAFRNNPRQIIQFVNILLANYLLIEERQGSEKDFPPDFLKENTPQLTKYLILNQTFPEEMDFLREQKALSLSERRMRDNTEYDFIKFLDETEDIQINDLRVFFTLRKSDQEKKFPGLENFIANLQDGALEESSKQISEFGDFSDSNLVNGFSQVMKEEIQDTSNPVSRANLVGTLLSVLHEKQINLNGTLYEEINNLLKGSVREHLHTIPPDILNAAFLSKKATYRPAVVTQWVAILEDFGTGAKKYKVGHDFVLAIFKILTAQPDYLDSTNTAKIHKMITENFARDTEVANAVTQSPDVRKKFVTSDYVRSFIESIPDSSTYDDLEKSLKIANTFEDSSLQPYGGEAVIRKFISIQLTSNQDTKPESYPEKKKVLDQFREFVLQHRDVFVSATPAGKDAFMDALVTGFNAPSDFGLRSVFVPILYSLRGLVTDPKWQEAEGHIAAWGGNVDGDNFIKTVNIMPQEDKDSLFGSGAIFKALSRHAIADADLRTVFVPVLSEEKKAEFLNRFLSTEVDSALEYLDWLDVKDAKFMLLSLSNLIDTFDQGNPTQKSKIFILLNEQEKNMDELQKNMFIEKAKSCLVTSDVSLHSIGQAAFVDMSLTKESKVKLINELMIWVRTSGVPISNQRAAIDWLVGKHIDLTDQDKSDLIVYLLSNIIVQTSDIALISESFSWLTKLDPKYELQTENFEALKSRVGSGIGEDVKTAIIDGLGLIRPKKTNKANKDFWDWVTSQKQSE